MMRDVITVEWKPGPLALLDRAMSAVHRANWSLVALVIITQAVIILVAFPLQGWLFREALRADGMLALDMASFRVVPGLTLTIGLLLAIMVMVFYLAIIQFTAFVLLVNNPGAGLRGVLGRLGTVTKKVFRWSSLPIAAYVLLLIPLAGFGFVSSLIQSVAIPHFITGEIAKEPLGQIGLWVFFAAVIWLNIRFALAIPLFALTDAKGSQAMKQSWHLTRGLRFLPLVFAVVAVLILGFLTIATLMLIALLPTVLSDAAWPIASPIVAAYSLGLAQVATMVIVGFMVAAIAAVLMTFIDTRSELLWTYTRHQTTRSSSGLTRRLGLAVLAVATVGIGTLDISTMRDLDTHPETIVFAHRGYVDNAVENTIEALDAAHAAGADIVEMDVMQTKDGEFVVMHDTNLARLTGQNLNVKDITFEEATSLTVRDAHGNEGKLPGLLEYAQHAKEIDQPLLIEIKLSGAETPTHVADLLTLLEENDLLDGNIFHSLDASSVQELKEMRPDATVGYIMPVAGVQAPDTLADFLVVEESMATQSLQDRVTDEDLGFVVWTPNEDNAIRDRLRRGSHGIVTDKVERALAARQQMTDDPGLAGVLYDAMIRFVLP